MNERKLYIAVMDYGNGEVRFYKADLTDGEYDNEMVEDWLMANDSKFKESQCHYMFSEQPIEVKLC